MATYRKTAVARKRDDKSAGASTDLVRYDAMCRAIDAAHEVDEVKDIRDKAIAFEVYSRQAKNVEAERQACEICLRAERKAGTLLRDMEKAKGAKEPDTQRGTTRLPEVTTSPTFENLGVSKKQSADWQKLASVPQKEFDHALADAERPTTAGIIRAVTAPKVTPVSKDALYLWGRLRDFDSLVICKTPAEIMATMTPEMLDDTHTLAPKVAAWLKQIGQPTLDRQDGPTQKVIDAIVERAVARSAATNSKEFTYYEIKVRVPGDRDHRFQTNVITCSRPS